MMLRDQDHAEIAIHATAAVVGEKGVLLRGPSGAGKSALADELLHLARAAGVFARLVGDDRILARWSHGRLIIRPHAAVCGLIEQRFAGLERVNYEESAVAALVVDLLDSRAAPPDRLPDSDAQANLCGGEVPLLVFPADYAPAGRQIFRRLMALIQ